MLFQTVMLFTYWKQCPSSPSRGAHFRDVVSVETSRSRDGLEMY